MVPFNDLNPLHEMMADELQQAVSRVLRSGWYVLGAEVEAFEAELSQFLDVRRAVGVASGTDALELIFRGFDVGPGDEVITVSHTAVATVCAIERAGGTPVLVDIDPTTYTMSPEAAAAAITPRTKAIVPVHLYGHPADLASLAQLAKEHDLKLIEDAAQSIDARFGDRPTGTWGDAAALSFYPTKNLGACGDAGAVVTNDDRLARRVRGLRCYGQRDRNEFHERGINSRLDEMQAAILRIKLRHLDEHRELRREMVADYHRQLKGLTLPAERGGVRHAYHLYVVRHPQRDKFREMLAAHGVETLIHYPVPVHMQGAYTDLKISPSGLPETERAAREVLSLPLYIGLTEEQRGVVISAAHEALCELTV